MKQLRKLSAMVLGCSMLLAGCGNVNSKIEADSSNTIVYGSSATTGLFSPVYSTTVYDNDVVDLVFNSFLEYNKKDELVPSIADGMPKISNGGKTITYKLKKGIKFSDGSKLTTKDVRVSNEVLADKTYTGPSGYEVQNLVGYEDYYNGKANHIKGIKIIDDYTISFNYTKADSDNLINTGLRKIVSDKQFKDYKNGNAKLFEDLASKPIGSGPYKLVKYSKSSGVGLTKNKYYWGKGYKIKNVVMKPVTPTTAFEDLKVGNVDILEATSGKDTVGLASHEKNIGMQDFVKAGSGYICLNTQNGATKEKAVRQALLYAFDRKTLVNSYFKCTDCAKGIGQNLGYIQTTFQNPASSMQDIIIGKEKLEGLNTYPYDINKAKQLLDNAGWKVGKNGIRYKDGKPLTIKMLAMDDSAICDTLIPIWKKDWQERLGVDFKVTTVDFNTLVSKISSDKGLSEWNVFMLGVSYTTATLSGPKTSFQSSEAKEGGGNYGRLKDSEIDKLIDEATATNDPKEQKALWEQIAIKVNDQAVYMPIYGYNPYSLYRKDRIKNFEITSLYTWTHALKNAEIVKDGE